MLTADDPQPTLDPKQPPASEPGKPEIAQPQSTATTQAPVPQSQPQVDGPDDDRGLVIVTGSSGMIGSPTCLRLAELGYQVAALDRPGAPHAPHHHPSVTEFECDLTDEQAVGDALKKIGAQFGQRIQSVVHLAAYYDFSGADSPLYDEVTVQGTERLLRHLDGFEVDQFVFSSSMLVHHPCEIGEHIDESGPLKAKWPYPESKIETETLIREHFPDQPAVFLRIAGVYNDWGKQPTLVQQIKRIYEGQMESHFFPGDQKAGQSCLHIDDTVDAIIQTVEHRAALPHHCPMLIGESDPPSYQELQETISRCLDHDHWTTIWMPPAIAKLGASVIDSFSSGKSFIKPFMIALADDHYALDISYAENTIGWKPTHRLQDHVPAIVQKLKEDPEQWYQRNGLEAPAAASQ